jgi:hypothetical protein
LVESIATCQTAIPEVLPLPTEFRKRSSNYKKTGSASFGNEETYQASFPSEVSVHDAKLVRIAPNTFIDVGHQALEQWPILAHPFRLKPTRQCSKLLMPWGHGGASYGDFIIKVLPKLSRLLASVPAEERSSIGICLPHFTRHPWAVEYLALLGIDRKQIYDETTTVVVPSHGNVILGSGPATGHGISHPQDLRLMIQTLTGELQSVVPTPWRRLYISRKTGRSMSNESELIDGLRDRGFEILHLEELSLQEQISRFREASLVVGAHGAGHANIIWCIPGTHLVEVFHPSWMHPCYALLSQILGINYHCLVGEEDRSSGRWTEMSRYGIFENPAITPALLFNKIDSLISS